MASGFGTFDGNPVVVENATSMFIQTAVSQSVNQSARTVTVTVSSYVGYYRNSGGNWNTGNYTYFWRTNHTDAYFTNNIDGSVTNTITTKLAVGIPYSMTVTTGTKATVLNGLGSQYSDYGYVVTSSKTYNYDNNGSAITGNWSATLHEYNTNTGWHDATASGSFTTDSISPAASAPSGATVKFNSSTYNSINITSTVSSWGAGYTDTPHLQQIVCLPDSTASNWYQRGRLVHDNRTTAKTSTGTVTNSDQPYNGGLTIKGASNYKVACWASTTVGETHALSGVVYTPPAPIGTFTKLTETRGATAVATRFQIIGGSSSQNSSNSVTTQYRLSTDGGSTFGSWTNVGSAASAYTTKNLDLSIPYSASVQIQARQVYQGIASQTSTITYTALGPVAPSNPAITVNSKAWNSVNLTGSIDDYGYPSAASGRKINIGLADGNSGSPAGMEIQTANATSATVTVNQSSTAVRGGFTFKGMMTLYPYTFANNTLASNIVYGNAEVLPPAPGQITYSVDPNDASAHTVSFTGDATKNITTYTPVELTRTVRYADSNDPTNWTYIVNDANAPVDWVTTQNITVSAGHTITVEAWMTYTGIQSEVTTLSITNSSDPVRLYGAARKEDPDNPGTLLDPVAEEIEHLYGSVNGTAKKIKKLYASVNGVAKLIFEDI